MANKQLPKKRYPAYAKKKTSTKHRRVTVRRARRYGSDYRFDMFIDSVAENAATVPQARELLRRYVDNDELWELLAQAGTQEQERKQTREALRDLMRRGEKRR